MKMLDNTEVYIHYTENTKVYNIIQRVHYTEVKIIHRAEVYTIQRGGEKAILRGAVCNLLF